jgi:hypothetical protein
MAARRPMMRTKRTKPGANGAAAPTTSESKGAASIIDDEVPSAGDGPVLKAAAGQSRKQAPKKEDGDDDDLAFEDEFGDEEVLPFTCSLIVFVIHSFGQLNCIILCYVMGVGHRKSRRW